MNTVHINVRDESKLQYIPVLIGSNILAVSTENGTVLLRKNLLAMEEDFEDRSDYYKEFNEC